MILFSSYDPTRSKARCLKSHEEEAKEFNNFTEMEEVETLKGV